MSPAALPEWLSPIEGDDLDFFDGGRAPLLELSGLVRRLGARPVLLPAEGVSRLALWAERHETAADQPGWARAKELFFGPCLSAVLWLIQPDKLRLVRGRAVNCHGAQLPGQEGEWFPCVKVQDSGLEFAGWQREGV